jgi:hypothetical protein
VALLRIQPACLAFRIARLKAQQPNGVFRGYQGFFNGMDAAMR